MSGRGGVRWVANMYVRCSREFLYPLGWLGVIAQDGFFKTWEDGAPEGWSLSRRV